MAWQINTTWLKKLFNAFIEVYLTADEALSTDAVNWVSPGANIVKATKPSKNMNYTSQGIFFENDNPPLENPTTLVKLVSTVSMKAATANTQVEMSVSVNGVVDVQTITEHLLTTGNEVKNLVHIAKLEVSEGDRVDFEIRTPGGATTITLTKGVWNLETISADY